MIAKIIEYAIRARFIVILLTAAVAVLGVYCIARTPVDAIPDLSENQVIVFTDWMGRSPKEIDDQITYPLSVNLQGLAGVKSVRSSSEFNFSMITIIFDDKTDFYFARTRVQERLNAAATYLPAGIVPYLAPDATALGQIFWYTVEGDGYSLDELRSIQDFFVRYQLYVPGVAQVASAGGLVREYQIDVDPDKLRAYDIPLGAVYDAVARANTAVGGKVILGAKAEYLIRGVGWLQGARDLENVVIAQRNDVPITVAQLATVQLGPEFRRSLLEKNGREVTGGVVMMRFGQNPLTVTKAIKQRIEQLQPGLPKGVRIVPFYDRTRLIQGAIHTLSRTLTEEMIIASIAILLILTHFRSAFVVCITLPLAVAVSFILMYFLGIPSNIMSLSGIAISIGILVDAAVVMVENATHELKLHYGDQPVRGDTTEIVIRACRLVGKPIFFAVMIMLISFIPVFALGGQEGKMFHPLAFTKTFAMVGVAVLAITFVPAIIPILIKGRLRREEENWIVRSFINIYKPVLQWLMKVPAAGIWFLCFLFLVGTGLAGLLGKGAPWYVLALLGALLFAGSAFFRRGRNQAIALILLAATALWAWHLPKLGREFMPPLDEGSIMDMPVTSPRVSVAQAGDDIKVRDRVMASFPEVEQVVGKAGRADTPTDPAGMDMIETIVTLRPNDLWPKRKMLYDDALAEARQLARLLQQKGYLRDNVSDDQHDSLINAATMDGMAGFDRAMRDLTTQRQLEYQPVLARELVTQTVQDLLNLFRQKGRLKREPTAGEMNSLVESLVKDHGLLLVELPRKEEMTALLTAAGDRLAELKVVDSGPDLLLPAPSTWTDVKNAISATAGGEKSSVFTDFFDRFTSRLHESGLGRLKVLNWELQDYAPGAMDALLLSSLRDQAAKSGLAAATLASDADLAHLREQRQAEFGKAFFLWHKTKGDLVKEMDSELQMPGWANIWTQPIINRVDMLATGVRTMIGVKVFGTHQDDLAETVTESGQTRTIIKERGIQTVSNEIAELLRGVRGAVDVFPDQIVGRSYLQVQIDRAKAARYGVNVSDINDAVEIAMGGKSATTTVEQRQRFSVRVRYARDFWQTPEALAKTLVTAHRGTAAPQEGAAAGGMSGGSPAGGGGEGAETYPIPITDVAEIKTVEGPSVIKSENGMLRSYVQLNVRDRDIVGFVEEAQRVIAEKIKLPPGFYIEWSGQFEHQVRARQTLSVIFPLVVMLIFVILFLTFNNWRDALLIILTVPGALVGGVIFQSLFGFNFSVAVWVGYIACFGMATQTGIVMLVYLHDAIRTRGGLSGITSEKDLTDAIIAGAVHRLRPKLMTEGVAIIGLMPMLWAHGVGAEVIKPMAAPVLGGLLVADEVIDLLIPVIFNWYQTRRWRKLHAPGQAAAQLAVEAAV